MLNRRIHSNRLPRTVLLAGAMVGLLLCGACEPTPVAGTPTAATGAEASAGDAAPAAKPTDDQAALTADLKALAAIAGPILDGDECHAVLTARAYQTMWAIDPRDEWAAMDNYDYDEAVAIRVKKLLIRLARTRSYKADCNLWLNCPEKPDTVQCVIKQVNNCCPYAPWGALYQPTPEPMKKALLGEITVGIPSPDRVSVFAPIKNNMGDIIGVVECSSRIDFWKERK